MSGLCSRIKQGWTREELPPSSGPVPAAAGTPPPPPHGRASAGPCPPVPSFPESLWIARYDDPTSTFTRGPSAVAASFAFRRRLCPRAGVSSTSAHALHTRDPVLAPPAGVPLLPGPWGVCTNGGSTVPH